MGTLSQEAILLFFLLDILFKYGLIQQKEFAPLGFVHPRMQEEITPVSICKYSETLFITAFLITANFVITSI